MDKDKPVGTVEQVILCTANVYIVCINWYDNSLEVFNVGQALQWNKMECSNNHPN